MPPEPDDFNDLETELRRLRPRTPGPGLRTKVAAALATAGETANPALRWWRLGMPLAAAAAVAFAAWLPSPNAPRRASPAGAEVAARAAGSGLPADRFEPVVAATLPLEASEESLVTLEDGTIARRIRETSLATITWKNPRTQAALTWSVPREEIRLVPVSYQ